MSADASSRPTPRAHADEARFPPHPLLDLARWQLAHTRAGYDIARADAEAALFRARVPVLVVHGEKDSFVPPYMARRLFAAVRESPYLGVGERSGLVLFPHAGHCQSALADPERYYRELFGFIEECR